MALKVGKLNLIFSTIVFITNLLNLYTFEELDLLSFALRVFPFMISAALSVWLKDNAVYNSFTLLIVGILSMSVGSYTNTVGVTLMCYSFQVNKSKTFMIASLTLFLCAFISKILLTGIDSEKVVGGFVLNAFIILVYFSTCYESVSPPQKTSLLTPEQHEVLVYLIRGYTHKEIVDKLSDHVSVHTVRKRIQRACKKYKCSTTYELIFRLSQSGHLLQKMDKLE